MKRLIRKGLVKTSRINAKRIAYYLTPSGFTEKFRLVMNYTRRTISFFSAVRQMVRQKLRKMQEEKAVRTIAIVGTGEIAEAVYLTAQELGIAVSAVFSEDPDISEWLGLPVASLRQGAPTAADAVIISTLDELNEVRASVSMIAPVVVEMRELLSSGLAAFAKRVEQETEEDKGAGE